MILNGVCVILGVVSSVGLITENSLAIQVLREVDIWAVPKGYCVAFLIVHTATMAWLVQILYQDTTGMATGNESGLCV